MRSTFLIAIAIFPLCAAEFLVTDLSRDSKFRASPFRPLYKGKAAAPQADR